MIEYKLATGKVVDLNVLTVEELQYLLLVDTSVGQASAIYSRNEAALEQLRRYEAEGGLGLWERVLGCPHCARDECGVFQCHVCKWRRASLLLGGTWPACICCGFTFGGVNARYVRSWIGLCVDSIVVREGSWIVYGAACGYLEGHMEWAAVVLALGGTYAAPGIHGLTPEGLPWR